ncbi:MAG: right-handed parallel beta-helix repeat-containing protein, partial [Nanoarchaeota archaeon]
MRLQTVAVNNTIVDNLFNTTGSSLSNIGIRLTDTIENNTFANNTILTGGTFANQGLSIETNSNRNQFIANTVVAAGGISHGIFLTVANNNTFTSNNITATGAASYAVFISGGNGSLFNNTLLANPTQWLFSGVGSNNSFINTTFFMPNASVVFRGKLNASAPQNVTRSILALGFNAASLNASNASFMNASANITFRDLPFFNPQINVSFNDDGVSTNCSASVCQKTRHVDGELDFNVAHWTNYTTQENIQNISCGNIDFSTRLNQDVNSTGDCFNITGNDVTIDCAGFTINYSQGARGHAITARNKTHVTITNCSIVTPMIGAGQTGAHAINLTLVPNATVRDSNISIMSSTGVGIFLSYTLNASIIGNHINTSSTGAGQYGILLTLNGHGALIANNTIYANGTGTAYGINLVTNTSNVTIINNSISTNGAGSSNFGINVQGVTHNQSNILITGNTIYTNGTGSGHHGIEFASVAKNNSIINNTIRTTGRTIDNVAISLLSGSDGNLIADNFITTNGTSGNIGIELTTSDNNTIANNTIVAGGASSGNNGIVPGSAGGSNIII